MLSELDTVRGVDVLLRGGPGDGQMVPGGGETVVWQPCLYEITSEVGRQRGRDLRVPTPPRLL